MTNVRKNSAKLTREDLKIAPESPTMKLSETPAVEPSDQTQAAKLVPLVYRVDEIAQTLGISKRTLYEMFADKDDLINACLDAMSSKQRERIATYRKQRSGSALQRTFKLAYEYIANLYMVESSFLSDLRHKIIYADHFDEHREFWRRELAHHLEASKEEGLLLPEIEGASFADRILETILELRLNNATREEVYLFCRTILRGAATRQGIERIDRKR